MEHSTDAATIADTTIDATIDAADAQPELSVDQLWDLDGDAQDPLPETAGTGQADSQTLSSDPPPPQAPDAPHESDSTPPDGGDSEPQTGQSAPESPSDGAQDNPSDQPTKQEDRFILRHLDDPPRAVGREEVIQLAQKGLDYDRVQAERDQLRQYRAQTQPALDLVRQFADKCHMSVEQYIDYCREQALIQSGVNEATAKAQVETEKQKILLDAQAAAAQAQRQQQQEAQRRAQAREAAMKKDMSDFLAAYPGVKADQVPVEVWQEVAQGRPLLSAYALYENRQLHAQLAAKEQNRTNAGLAPGGMNTQGVRGHRSIAELWDAAGE